MKIIIVLVAAFFIVGLTPKSNEETETFCRLAQSRLDNIEKEEEKEEYAKEVSFFCDNLIY